MTQNSNDPSMGTDLTEQQATDLNARDGRGARQEPGAQMDDAEAAQGVKSDAEGERPGLDPARKGPS